MPAMPTPTTTPTISDPAVATTDRASSPDAKAPAGPDLPGASTSDTGTAAAGQPVDPLVTSAKAGGPEATAARPVGSALAPATDGAAGKADDPGVAVTTQTATSAAVAGASATSTSTSAPTSVAAAPTAAVHPGAAVQPDTNAIAAAVTHQPAVAAPTAASHAAPLHATPLVTAQLVAAVGPLKIAADGVQTLTLMLHPADLGSVQVRAELRDGVVSLQLIGSTDVGREALRAALPDLRRDLMDAGVTTGSLELGAGSPDTGAFSRNSPEGREASRRDPFMGLPDGTATMPHRVADIHPEHGSRGSRGLDVSI